MKAKHIDISGFLVKKSKQVEVNPDCESCDSLAQFQFLQSLGVVFAK